MPTNPNKGKQKASESEQSEQNEEQFASSSSSSYSTEITPINSANSLISVSQELATIFTSDFEGLLKKEISINEEQSKDREWKQVYKDSFLCWKCREAQPKASLYFFSPPKTVEAHCYRGYLFCSRCVWKETIDSITSCFDQLEAEVDRYYSQDALDRTKRLAIVYQQEISRGLVVVRSNAEIELRSLKGQMSKFENDNVGLRAQKKSLESRVGELENTNQTLTSEQQKAIQELAENQIKYDKLQRSLENINAFIEANKKKEQAEKEKMERKLYESIMSSLNREKIEATEKLHKEIEEEEVKELIHRQMLEERIRELEKQIEELNLLLKANEDNLSIVEAAKESALGLVDIRNRQLGDKDIRIGELERLVSGGEKFVEKLQGDLSASIQNYDDIKEQTKSLIINKKVLEDQVKNQVKTINQLEKEAKEKDETIANLNTQITNLNKTIETLKKEKETLNGKYERAKRRGTVGLVASTSQGLIWFIPDSLSEI